MSDLERRVRDVLVSVADQAPMASGLADAARRRARGRRRAWVAGVGAVMVAAVAVPVALTFGRDAPDGGPVGLDPADTPTAVPSSGPEVPEGWRVETWRDLTVQVPDGWGVGGRSAWCAGGGEPDVPVVQRPGTVVELIDCGQPEYSLGLNLGSSAAYDPVYPSGHVWQYPRGDVEVFLDGSWLGHWYDDRRLVQVNAADRETVERILASVEVADDGWGTVEHGGLTVDLPPGWAELDVSGCEVGLRGYAPTDVDSCAPEQLLAFYGSALFDPVYGPGSRRSEDGSGWSGYTYAGDVVVWISASRRAVVERVLDSAHG